MTRLLIATITLLVVLPASAKTEFGKLLGAEYRMDVPDHWNHGLVVYCHGYEPRPEGGHYDRSQPLEPDLTVFVKAGYALIQSGYSRGGWALEQAIPEIEALRKAFIEKFGQPKETYIAGHSLGGLLTVAILEKSPEFYDGGLDLCGVVGGAAEVLSHAFDHRVIFDYLFPGALPSPVKIPRDFHWSEEAANKLYLQLQANPRATATVRRITGIRNDKDLADVTLFGTYVLKDIEERAGGNPFDNRNTIYLGTDDDNALNDGVKRYTADPGALAYLKRHQTLTGHLTRPVLAIHTTYDPLVSPTIPNAYSLRAREAGSGNLFVQQYVMHDGHCAITPEEVETGFKELRHWKETRHPPKAGWLH